MDFLPSSFGFDPLGWTAGRDFASQVLWFDALVHNVDRTWRNPNLLVWHRDIWLIDHGAALYFHHNWPGTADPKRALRRAASTCCATAPPRSPTPMMCWPRR